MCMYIYIYICTGGILPAAAHLGRSDTMLYSTMIYDATVHYNVIYYII